MGRFVQPFSGGYWYDEDELRDSDEGEDDGPDPNYECQRCDNKQYIDDYQKHTPAWCRSCGGVRHFERLEGKG